MHRRASAPTGTSRVQIGQCPSGAAGISLDAAEALRAGDAALVEAPIITVQNMGGEFDVRRRRFEARLSGSSQEETATMVNLAVLKSPYLRAYAEASCASQEKILSLQTEFAEPECSLARATARLAQQFCECGYSEGLPEEVVHQVLACCLINNFDFEPNGCTALLYMGSIFQHSCEPNAKFHIVQAQEENGGRRQWVGEYRAICSIGRGEAVYVSYLTDDWLRRGREQRRTRMLVSMGFLCRCTRCEREKVGASGLPLERTQKQRVDRQSHRPSQADSGSSSTTNSSSSAAQRVNACAAAVPSQISWADPAVRRILTALARQGQ